jgi:hypothetical protein
LKPVVALATTALVGASLLSPVLAASNTRTQHMRTTQPMVQAQMAADPYNAYNQAGNGSWSNERFNAVTNFGQGTRCVTDEGYGRWSYCDGGSN